MADRRSELVTHQSSRAPGLRYPCSCCGHRTLESPPGLHDICPVCFWEDDVMQLRWPCLERAANGVSLVTAQDNYRRTGACEERFEGSSVRMPLQGEETEPWWHPVDLTRDRFEETLVALAPWPNDRTVLYWWSERYWSPREDAEGTKE
ncbi:hypothetical protein LCE31_01970 [Streptomyces sp. 8L]|nr:hypothetical protein [Streptomyces sp. 8L]